MHIYGSMLSPYVARVAMAARHKGIKHTLQMPDGGMKCEAYLKLNPLGKIPAIKDGATVLFESPVILEYLDVKYKKKRLVPSSAKDAAKARLIGAVFAEYLEPHVLALSKQRKPEMRNQQVVDAKLAEVSHALDVAERMLVGTPYAAGAKLSIADCYAVPALFYLHAIFPAFGIENPIGPRKKLTKYMARVKKDKLTATVLADMAVALANFRR